MKLRFFLPLLALSVLVYDASAQEVGTNTAPAGAQRDAITNAATAGKQTQRATYVVDGASTNAQPMSVQARRAGRLMWAVDMQPAVILANMAADGFSVNGEELSLISSMPNITLGADLACCDGYLGLRLGVGMLLNASLGTWFATGQAGFSMEVQRNVMFGPHIGLSYYAAPEWWGDTDVFFNDTIGYLIGIHVVAGDRISYLFSVDYMSMAFDVDRTRTGEGVRASKTELDMSGLAVQFGLRVQF